MSDIEDPDSMTFGLALAFDTDTAEFARGVEVGRLWEKLSANPDDEIVEVVHVTNAEMVIRLGESLNRIVESREHDDTWMSVRFAPALAVSL
jgi:hypothetical protein